MARELEVLAGVLDDPRRPLVAVLGGAKISSKLGVLTNLLSRVDSLHVGGAMACTFFRAMGAGTGRSLVEAGHGELAQAVLEVGPRGVRVLSLPIDVVVAAEHRGRCRDRGRRRGTRSPTTAWSSTSGRHRGGDRGRPSSTPAP